MSTAPADALRGMAVLITRPQGQAERLARIVAAAGGEAIVFPTIEIRPLADPAPLQSVLDRLDEFQIAVFVSANAVDISLPLLLQRRAIPADLRFAAVGSATRTALEGFGIGGVISPTERHDSEGLLSLPEMIDVAGRRIVIFRGESGRELIAETLVSRGGQVEYAVCYRRVRPRVDTAELAARWRAGRIHAVSAMSLESIRNLYDMLDRPTRQLLAATPVLVPHARIADDARKLGLTHVRVTGHSDEALIESLSQCRKP